MISTNGAGALKKIHKALDEAQVAVEIASYRFTRATDPRVRLVMATFLVLLLHLWFLWAILASHPGVWNVPDMQTIDDTPTVELWTPEPPPEPVPPVERTVTEVQPQPQPRQAAQPQPKPEPQPQPAPQQQAAPPQPVVQPVAAPQIAVPKVEPAPVLSDTTAPVIDAQTRPTLSTKVKKKAAAQLAKSNNDDIITSVSDLNLHQVPVDAPVLSTVEPSGLPAPAKGAPATNQAQGGQPAGGRLGAMQGQGVPGAGVLGKGRGGLTQAMQNHDYCVAQQQAGKPIPAGCDMADLASMSNIPGRRVGAYDAALAKKAYTAAPGNTDYWQRVNGVPVDPGKDDHMPKRGAYTTAKDQRMVGGCIDDSSCKGN